MATRTPKSSTYDSTQPPDFDPDVPSRERILRALREADHPLSLDELAERLKVERSSTFAGFERRLAAMERDGQLLPNRKGKLLLASRLDFVAGKVQGHRDGFGFLIRDDGNTDIYLAPREMLKVLHGDRVLVRPSGEYRGKPDGQIVEVLERGTQQLVGRLQRERGLLVVVPEDQRVRHDVLVAPGDESHAKVGQVVTVELLTQPSRYQQPQGKVVEVLGDYDDPGMEIEIAVRKFDLPHEFSAAAIKAARALPHEVTRDDLKGRFDLRDVPFVTIDGIDARDFDDAVFCEAVQTGSGSRSQPGWRLLVAIADVSHYVKTGDAIDNDALERATSVYFPRRVIPMLPEELSNGLCSLNPGVDRLALVCDMVIPAKGARAGEVTAYQFYNAVIHSHGRTTYDQVWEVLSGEPSGMPALSESLHPHLHNLHELFQLLFAARQKRGAIDFDTIETGIICDEDGRIERIEAVRRNDAHRLIEECMLAANTCAADFLLRSKHPGLFRVHDGPTEERLEKLRDYLKTIGLTLGGGDKPQAADYGKMLEQAADRPDLPLIQIMCLRSMQAAVYSPDNLGHFGLAYAAYSHFTSPIRRYPDLLTHRVIKALLQGKRYRPQRPDHLLSSANEEGSDDAAWEELGQWCSMCERRAEEASRDVEAWLKCWYMKEHVGSTFHGTVTGVASFGIFITLNELFVEGMVHVSELGSDYFQYMEDTHELRGERTGKRFRLTTPVTVQVARVDLDSRRIEFRLVDAPPQEPQPEPEFPEVSEPPPPPPPPPTGKSGRGKHTGGPGALLKPSASAARAARKTAAKASSKPAVDSGAKGSKSAKGGPRKSKSAR